MIFLSQKPPFLRLFLGDNVMKAKINLLILIVFFCCSSVLAQEQNKSIPQKPKVEIKITSCHENNSELSILDQYTERDELIINPSC